MLSPQHTHQHPGEAELISGMVMVSHFSKFLERITKLMRCCCEMSRDDLLHSERQGMLGGMFKLNLNIQQFCIKSKTLTPFRKVLQEKEEIQHHGKRKRASKQMAFDLLQHFLRCLTEKFKTYFSKHIFLSIYPLHFLLSQIRLMSHPSIPAISLASIAYLTNIFIPHHGCTHHFYASLC